METKYEIANPNPILSEYQSVFFFTEQDLTRLQQAAKNPIGDFEPYHIPPLRTIWLACQPQAPALTELHRLQLSAQLVQYFLQMFHARVYVQHQANAAALATIPELQQEPNKSVILKKQAELAKHEAKLTQHLVLLEPLFAACANNTPIPADATTQLIQSLNWLVANHFFKLRNDEHLDLLTILGFLLELPIGQHLDYVKRLEDQANSTKFLLAKDNSKQAVKVKSLLPAVLNYKTNYHNSFIAPPLPNFAELSSALTELAQTNPAYSEKLQEFQTGLTQVPAIAIPPADHIATSILTRFNSSTKTRIAEVARDRDRSPLHIFENILEEKKTSAVPAPSLPKYISRLHPTHITSHDAPKYKSNLIIINSTDLLQGEVAGIVFSPFVKQLFEKVLFQSDWQASMLGFLENALDTQNAIPQSTTGSQHYTYQRKIRLIINAKTKQVEWVIAEIQRVSLNLDNPKPEFGLFAALQITEAAQQDQTNNYAPGTFPPLPFYYGLYSKPEHQLYFQHILQGILNKSSPSAAAAPSSFFVRNLVPILGMASLGALLCTGSFLALYFFIPALTLSAALPPVGIALALIGISIAIAFAGAALFGAITSLILKLKEPPPAVIPAPVPIDLSLTPEEKQLQNWLTSVCLEMYRPGTYSKEAQPSPLPVPSLSDTALDLTNSSASILSALTPPASSPSDLSVGSDGEGPLRTDSDDDLSLRQGGDAFDLLLTTQHNAPNVPKQLSLGAVPPVPPSV